MGTVFHRTTQDGLLSAIKVLRKSNLVLRSLSLFAQQRACHHVLSAHPAASDISLLCSFTLR
jgi:hypothetical protein